ncbi:hypothetical protein GCM10009691_11040 [Brevibacterium picturae]|uniref:Uncharacterized protein n=1 Tax=Brevibacterium picturae TaxID=260553 RepID=A0ABN2BDK6_9MICO
MCGSSAAAAGAAGNVRPIAATRLSAAHDEAVLETVIGAFRVLEHRGRWRRRRKHPIQREGDIGDDLVNAV